MFTVVSCLEYIFFYHYISSVIYLGNSYTFLTPVAELKLTMVREKEVHFSVLKKKGGVLSVLKIVRVNLFTKMRIEWFLYLRAKRVGNYVA